MHSDLPPQKRKRDLANLARWFPEIGLPPVIIHVHGIFHETVTIQLCGDPQSSLETTGSSAGHQWFGLLQLMSVAGLKVENEHDGEGTQQEGHSCQRHGHILLARNTRNVHYIV